MFVEAGLLDSDFHSSVDLLRDDLAGRRAGLGGRLDAAESGPSFAGWALRFSAELRCDSVE